MSVERVAVVGGGIAGLAAAHALATSADPPHVTLFEAGDAPGGKLRTSAFAGVGAVDEGPDAFLARLPWATALARSVGLGDHLVSPQSGAAWVWWDRMHAIPGGLLLGLPTGVRAMAGTRLLSWGGKARAALEPFLPRSATDHDTLGRWVRHRFGAQVHERLVDPLVGSIYAADTDHFSLAAVPQLAELAAGPRSVLLGARTRPPAPAGPVFYAPVDGMGSFAAAVASAFVSVRGEIRLGSPVAAVSADGSRWRVEAHRSTVAPLRAHHPADAAADSARDEVFDAVVLACPAPDAAVLLSRAAPMASTGLRALPGADVALITLAVPADSLPAACAGRSGYLVPKPKQRLVTAVSFGSNKWGHWRQAHQAILRVSLGRDGLPVLHLTDEALTNACLTEVGAHLGMDLQPTHVRVSRWPRAFPQYRPQHAATVAAITAALPAGVTLAGASYHGIGIPACVRSGQAAAAALLGAADSA